ncbi:MAG: HDOD domain-containing protein [Verrucomicrobia bacterium]|nr:HDOD domain-containing protein [Verrucomicrobiota bacterium]
MTISTPTIESLVQATPSSLGSYGPLLREIESALASPQSSLGSIAEIIEKDPDLTSRLLRFANSAYCGFSTRLSTVSEAIGLIGVQQVQDLLTASSVIEQFTDVADEFVNMQSFWEHSLACGIGARLIAMEGRLPKPDRFFVAGLLHDIGRLVLFLQSPKIAQRVFELYRKEHILLREAEVKVMGFDHQGIAEALLRNWKYPPALVHAVGYHHCPQNSSVGQMEASVVHVSDHLVNAMQMGSSGERHVSPLNPQAWAVLNLKTAVLEPVMIGIDEQIEAAKEMFLKS